MADTATSRKQAERRRFARFQIPTASIRCARAGFLSLLQKPFEAELVNLSACGMRMKTPAPLRRNDEITGRITIEENGDIVDVTGRVVWSVVIPPSYRGDAPVTIVGVLFRTSDVTRTARIESMRHWFTSNRYKTTRHLA
jgi:hypothetical protein